MFAAETVEKVKRANPRLKLVEVNSGHDVAGDDPAGFLREARAFLDTQGEEVHHVRGHIHARHRSPGILGVISALMMLSMR
jgi:hypothetical protein